MRSHALCSALRRAGDSAHGDASSSFPYHSVGIQVAATRSCPLMPGMYPPLPFVRFWGTVADSPHARRTRALALGEGVTEKSDLRGARTPLCGIVADPVPNLFYRPPPGGCVVSPVGVGGAVQASCLLDISGFLGIGSVKSSDVGQSSGARSFRKKNGRHSASRVKGAASTVAVSRRLDCIDCEEKACPATSSCS